MQRAQHGAAARGTICRRALPSTIMAHWAWHAPAVLTARTIMIIHTSWHSPQIANNCSTAGPVFSFSVIEKNSKSSSNCSCSRCTLPCCSAAAALCFTAAFAAAAAAAAAGPSPQCLHALRQRHKAAAVHHVSTTLKRQCCQQLTNIRTSHAALSVATHRSTGQHNTMLHCVGATDSH